MWKLHTIPTRKIFGGPPLTVLLAVLLPLFLFPGACQFENIDCDTPPVDPESALVTLSVSSAGPMSLSRAAVPEADQESIKNIYVLQVYSSGVYNGTVRRAAEGVPDTQSGKYKVNLLKSNAGEKYNLYVLANVPREKFLPAALTGKPYTEVLTSIWTSGKINGTLTFYTANGVPMFGSANNDQPLEIREGMDITNIKLIRNVARVDIGIGTYNGTDNTWNKGSIKFKMKTIEIRKVPDEYSYFPAPGKYTFGTDGVPQVKAATPVSSGETTFNYSTTAPNPDIVNNTYCKNSIFLPELAMSGTIFDDSHTSRMAIIVGGRYGTDTQDTYYRVDFSHTNENSLFSVLRNNLYRFTISDITSSGLPTADEAYNSKPVNLRYAVSVEPWKDGVEDYPQAIIGFRMVYGGYNGSVTSGMIKDDKTPSLHPDTGYPKTVSVKQKTKVWNGRTRFTYGYDYNKFTGESNNFWAQQGGPEPYNGDLYTSLQNALDVEGVYPDIMVAGDDLTDDQGSDKVLWKDDNGKFPARDLCKNYYGDGFLDWRLPRLSELVYIYFNHAALKAEPGFVPMQGRYWSNSEFTDGPDYRDSPSPYAYTFQFDLNGDGRAMVEGYKNQEPNKVRCVRQMNSNPASKTTK